MKHRNYIIMGILACIAAVCLLSPGPREVFRDIARKNQVFEAGDSQLIPSEDLGRPRKKDYTLMVYMTGSNLESQFGSATRDLLEMEQAGVDYEKSNVLVFTGGSMRWMGRVPSQHNCVLDLGRPEESRIVARTEKNADMGASETLASFLNFSLENYPAKHYGLIFWDHGGGPIWGYGSDELFGGDSLELSEMVYAMENTPFAERKRLDFVGFDACLMGSLECMGVWSRYADYYVASQDLEPGEGWDYSFLEVLNRSTDAVEISRAIVDAFAGFYSDTPGVTLSCVDLKQLEETAEALDSFSLTLSDALSRGGYPELQKARSTLQSFGQADGSRTGAFQYDLVDLGALARTMGSGPEAQALADSLDRSVVLKYPETGESCGISLYFPFRNKGQFSGNFPEYRRITPSRPYLSFLDSLTDPWLGSKSRDWSLGALTPEGRELTLALTPDQQENTVAAYYTVLAPTSDYSFYPILSRVRIFPDSQGVLHVPACPPLVHMVSDASCIAPWPAEQVGTSPSGSLYRVNRTALVSDATGAGLFDAPEDWLNVSVLLRQQGDLLTVQSVNSLDPDGARGGKSTVTADHREMISYSVAGKYPQRDGAGNLRPVSEWSGRDVWNTIHLLPLTEEISFRMQVPDAAPGDYCIQVELEDVSGEYYATELTPAAGTDRFRTLTRNTPAGTMTFALYDDHAALLQYEGQDPVLELPARVEGLPLTVLCGGSLSYQYELEQLIFPDTLTDVEGYAVNGCSDLAALRLPDTVTSIGPGAFSSCTSLEEVRLPPKLEVLGKQAFEGCTKLKRLELPAGLLRMGEAPVISCPALESITAEGRADASAPGYLLRDGVLFSPDGLTLLAFPAGRTGAYPVPQGTKSIGYGAFCQGKLEEVLLPDSLISIENCAFEGCEALAVPRLPDSLQSIGHHAFGTAFWTEVYGGPVDPVPEIRIGSRLEFLGAGAFDLFGARTFTVSPDNPRFSSVDGHLCNGAGDALIAFALDGTPAASLPESVPVLRWSNLSFLNNQTFSKYDSRYSDFDLYLPESSTLAGFPGDLISKDKLCLHGEENSPVHRCAMELGLTFEFGPLSPYSLRQVPTELGQMTFRVYDDHALLENYEGTDESLSVPAQVDGLPVTVVGSGRTAIHTSSLRSLTLPDSVEIIGADALDLLFLDELTLPGNLRRLEENAIQALGLTLDSLPASIEYLGPECLSCRWEGSFPIRPALRELAPGALDRLEGLRTFTLEGQSPCFSLREGSLCSADGKTLICICPETEQLTVPQGVERIGDRACIGDLLELTLPEGLKVIGASAFRDCRSLAALTLPAGLEEIGPYAFRNCEGLEAVTIPGSVKRVSDSAFEGCSSLRSLTLEEGVEALESSAFRQCPLLTEITLPESLLSLGYQTFYRDPDPGVSPAGVLTIGPNLAEIPGNAFEGLPITDFAVSPDNLRFGARNGILTTRDGMVALICPSGRRGPVTLAPGTAVLEFNLFAGCAGVTDVYIPDSVREIRDASLYRYLDEDFNWVTPAVLHCSPDSPAVRFARENGVTCITE